jgi:hypothetical protein
MLLVMDNKTWIIEVVVVACLMAAVMVTFTFMVGHALCMSLARK